MMDDLTQMPDEEFATLSEAVTVETQRRAMLRVIPEQIAGLSATYLNADGRVDGAPWRQPYGAHDAYPLGWAVSHLDRTWESLVAGNVWEPPLNWREQAEPGEYPAWRQPGGAHDAYSAGDRVRHADQVWESDVDGNVWEPGVHGWTVVEQEG